jgi:hypothetical protein
MKFFCLLLCHFASRQYWQIFRHRETKGDISNIANTYLTVTLKFITTGNWYPALKRITRISLHHSQYGRTSSRNRILRLQKFFFFGWGERRMCYILTRNSATILRSVYAWLLSIFQEVLLISSQ